MLEAMVVRPFCLIFPLMMGGIFHMIVVKKDWFATFKNPIHREAFGRNKTWRGFLVMPLAVMIGWALLNLMAMHLLPKDWTHGIPTPWWKIGPILGLAYVVGELPNSFLKRRMGIKEGLLPENGRWFFFLLDHLDSTLSCLTAYVLLFGVDRMTAIFCLVWSLIIHTSVNYGLYFANIRKNPF